MDVYLFDEKLYFVTPENYHQSQQYQSVLIEENQSQLQLEAGTTFYLSKVGGEGMSCDAPQSSESEYTSLMLEPDCSGESHMVVQQHADLSTQATGQPPLYTSQVDSIDMTLSQQYLEPYTYPQDGDYSSSQQDIPPESAEQAKPDPIPIDAPAPSLSAPPQSTPDTVIHPPPTPPELTCKGCRTLTAKHITLRQDIYCLNCALKYQQHQKKWMKVEKQPSWSPWEQIEVYQSLFMLFDESEKERLPADIPLPHESYICIARNYAVAPGYPAHGHIIGKGAKVVEGGCPNGHVLCMKCAGGIRSCPEPHCGAFVAYQMMPLGCPAYPGDENHGASFNKACRVAGCVGGVWPRKQPEGAEAEGTSPSQSKDEAPKNAAIAEEVQAELPEPAAKEGNRRNRQKKQINVKHHILTRSQTKRFKRRK